MIGWLRHQKHALTAALRRMRTQALTTLLTALAMGVAISLPSGLYLVLGNLDRLAGEAAQRGGERMLLVAQPGDHAAVSTTLP